MAQLTLSARIREKKGKGAARALRRDNQVPAIFYGPNTEPLMLAVKYPDLQGIVRHTTGKDIILDLQIESDNGGDIRKVLLKELQIDPIKDTFFHADFYEISMDKEITVDIPIRLVNTPLGVTEGGVLQHVRRKITISCLPDKLVEYIDMDVSGLEIGDALHIRDIVLPEDIKTSQEDHLTIAVVQAPAVIAEEEEEVEEEEVEEVEGAEKEVKDETDAGSE